MPTISIFFGIIIRTLEIIDGNLPKRALTMVVEWTIQNRSELQKNWKKSLAHEVLEQIKPLE